jgi:hypothetical protein
MAAAAAAAASGKPPPPLFSFRGTVLFVRGSGFLFRYVAFIFQFNSRMTRAHTNYAQLSSKWRAGGPPPESASAPPRITCSSRF